MKKQAYLILAHGSEDIFQELIKSIDFEYNDIFIHIDKSVNITPFVEASFHLKKSGVFFVEKRFPIKWGSYSIVQAEFELLKIAQAKETYSYYHLISGVDMLIKPVNEIFSFFDNSDGLEYIQYWSEKMEQKIEIKERYRYYDFFIPKRRNIIMKTIYHMTRKFNLTVQKGIGINRNSDVLFKLGSQWFSITNEFVSYILENEEKIEKIYKYTLVPDESFIQTLAFNSEWKEKIYSLQHENNYSLIKREINFLNGKPKVWKIEDVPYLLQSDNLFARKFEDISVVRELKERIQR